MNDFLREKIIYQRTRESLPFSIARGVPKEFSDENLSLYAAHLLRNAFKSTNLSSKGLYGPVSILKTENPALRKNHSSSKFEGTNDLKVKIPYLFLEQKGLNNGTKKLLNSVAEISLPPKKESTESYSPIPRNLDNYGAKLSTDLVRIKPHQGQVTQGTGDLYNLYKNSDYGASKLISGEMIRAPLHPSSGEKQANHPKTSENTSQQDKVDLVRVKGIETPGGGSTQNFRFVHVGSTKTPVPNRPQKPINLQICHDTSNSSSMKANNAENDKLAILFTQKFSKPLNESSQPSKCRALSFKKLSLIPDNEQVASDDERIASTTESNENITDRIVPITERATATLNRKTPSTDIRIPERKIMTTTSTTKKTVNLPTLNQRQPSYQNLTNNTQKPELATKNSLKQDPIASASNKKALSFVIPISKEALEIKKPKITAKSWVILDAGTGGLICSQNEEESRQVASLTKIMTCVCALRYIEKNSLNPLEEKAKVSRKAACLPGTSADLEKGDIISLWDLLFAMMLPSGNDAAFTIAEYLGKKMYCQQEELNKKPEEKTRSKVKPKIALRIFLRELNRTARDIGLTQTFFGNPHGLCHQNSHSTAIDMGKLCYVAMQDPTLKQIVGTQSHSCTIKRAEEACNVTWNNTNHLLGEGYEGIKTGMTVSAGPCLASCSVNSGQRIICVALCSQSVEHRFIDCKKLTEYGSKLLRMSSV